MKPPNLLAWKYSAVIMVGTGAILFYVGYRLGLVRDDELIPRRDQLFALVLTVGVPASITFSSAVVNREIQELSKDEIRNAQIERDKAIRKYQEDLGRIRNQYAQRLDSIKDALEPLKDFEDVYQKCLLEIEICQSVFDEFKKKSQAAADISHWLASKANRIQIRDLAITKVEEKYSIPAYQSTTFRNDIGRCINWLRDSIFALQGYEVRQDELARTREDITGGIDAYLVALEAIKSHPDLIRLSNQTNVLEDFITELMDRLKS